MSSAEDRKTRAADEFASEMESRDDARRSAEEQELKNLNQGMDATGHDAKHTGINWGPSYKARRKAKAKPESKEKK
jgi:hypothetical protein